jgi:phosphate transport system permease protein
MSEAATTTPTLAEPQPAPRRRRRAVMRTTSLFTHGEPMVWLTGGALGFALAMIVGLLGLIVYQGAGTFWPAHVRQFETVSGRKLAGEVIVTERFRPSAEVLDALPAEVRDATRRVVAAADGWATRRMLRTGNFDITGTHYQWVSNFEVASESEPEWMLVVERLTWGRFYGTPVKIRTDGQVRATEPQAIWDEFERVHASVRERWRERRQLETIAIGRVNKTMENARLELREVELAHGKSSPQWIAAQRATEATETAAKQEFGRIQAEIDQLKEINSRFELTLAAADGTEKTLALDEIVLAHPPNRLEFAQKVGVYLARTAEFLRDEPREANSEGGVFPAIFGTVVMTLLMSVLVVPFGVLAALYLREYAKPGPLVSAVRIAINNLAGVPSIVFGVFGLGFFCYIVGASIDQLLFAAKPPTPTYGKGGLIWAAFTLALLTLPVVIVPTEEALAAVPGSMREGSYACGATKWQTIWRIVLPRALPGIMTGMILALARGAGEVAPLMLVGAVKLAPELSIDGVAPYVHPERSFMHLGFHIYDLGFQSQNSEAAKPMVYTTTLLLIGIVVLLNLVAIWIRARLRRRFQGTHT